MRASLAAVCIVSLAAACGGASFDGTRFADDEARYEVGSLGRGWERVTIDDDVDLAWRHDGLAAIAHVNATCSADLDVPLGALTNHLLIGFTDRRDETREVVPMDGREAMITHVLVRLDGVDRELLLVVLKKDGCVYDLGLAAPPGEPFASARPAFEGLVRGFRAPSTEPCARPRPRPAPRARTGPTGSSASSRRRAR
jgi:hypothetical protein